MSSSFFYNLEKLKFQFRTGSLSNDNAFFIYAFISIILNKFVHRKIPLNNNFSMYNIIISGLGGIAINKFINESYKAKKTLFKEKGFDDATAYIVSGQR